MSAVEYLPSFSELISSGIAMSVAVAIGYFFRDRLAALFDANVQYRLEAKLEALKNELAIKSREIESLRASVLSIRTQRQGNIDRRRLEAVDQLWTAVKVLAPLRGACAMMTVFQWPEIAKINENSPESQKFFQSLSAGIPNELYKHDAHAARPFVSPLAWALFNAYQATLHYSLTQIVVLRNGAPPDMFRGPEELLKMLSLALPDWAEAVTKRGHTMFPDVVDEIENRLLSELHNNIEGDERDEAELERAAKIAALASKVELGARKIQIPESISRLQMLNSID